MKIIVGLGNPGKKYEMTRHNAGFLVLDKLIAHREFQSMSADIKFAFENKFNSEIISISHDGEKIILAKPQSFMNSSGDSVSKILEYFKAGIDDLIVISDDIDLPLGTARVRLSGSSGGQKGLEDIINKIGSDQFIRIRIGIGAKKLTDIESDSPEEAIDATAFVLSKFSDREFPIFEKTADEVVEFLLKHIKAKSEIISTTLE